MTLSAVAVVLTYSVVNTLAVILFGQEMSVRKAAPSSTACLGCIFFSLFLIDLSYPQSDQQEFPFLKLMFLISYSFSIIIFPLIPLSDHLLKMIKIYTILSYTLLELNTCLPSLLLKLDSPYNPFGIFLWILLVFAFSFAFMTGIRAFIIDLLEGSDLENSMEYDDKVASILRKGVKGFLIGIIVVSCIVNFGENNQIEVFGDGMWKLKSILGGIMFSILFPHFIGIFDFKKIQNYLYEIERDQIFEPQQLERKTQTLKNKLFLILLLSFILALSRFLLEYL